MGGCKAVVFLSGLSPWLADWWFSCQRLVFRFAARPSKRSKRPKRELNVFFLPTKTNDHSRRWQVCRGMNPVNHVLQEIWHEVLESHGDRYALTVWIHDRERAPLAQLWGALTWILHNFISLYHTLSMGDPAVIFFSFLCSFSYSRRVWGTSPPRSAAFASEKSEGSYWADIQFYPSYIPAATVGQKCWLAFNYCKWFWPSGHPGGQRSCVENKPWLLWPVCSLRVDRFSFVEDPRTELSWQMTGPWS